MGVLINIGFVESKFGFSLNYGYLYSSIKDK